MVCPVLVEGQEVPMTDKLSQAILLLRQATDIQLEAHKLLSEWQEAYGATRSVPSPAGIAVSQPGGPHPPSSAGGDSFSKWMETPDARAIIAEAVKKFRAD